MFLTAYASQNCRQTCSSDQLVRVRFLLDWNQTLVWVHLICLPLGAVAYRHLSLTNIHFQVHHSLRLPKMIWNLPAAISPNVYYVLLNTICAENTSYITCNLYIIPVGQFAQYCRPAAWHSQWSHRAYQRLCALWWLARHHPHCWRGLRTLSLRTRHPRMHDRPPPSVRHRRSLFGIFHPYPQVDTSTFDWCCHRRWLCWWCDRYCCFVICSLQQLAGWSWQQHHALLCSESELVLTLCVPTSRAMTAKSWKCPRNVVIISGSSKFINSYKSLTHRL